MAGDDRVFVHIKAFANRRHRPAVGDIVTYSVSTDARGRPRAEKAAISGARKTAGPGRSPDVLPHAIAAGFLLIVSAAALASAIPMPVLYIYLIISAATFTAYALDKSAARRGTWRTSESTLHVLSLAGGWPGALVAQNSLRHKSRKQPFRAIYWVTVGLNCAAFTWLFTPGGSRAWHTLMSAVA